jgi:hypothetical protein
MDHLTGSMEWINTLVTLVCPSSSSGSASSYYSELDNGTCQGTAMNSRNRFSEGRDDGFIRQFLQLIGLDELSCFISLVGVTMVAFATLGISLALLFGGQNKRLNAQQEEEDDDRNDAIKSSRAGDAIRISDATTTSSTPSDSNSISNESLPKSSKSSSSSSSSKTKKTTRITNSATNSDAISSSVQPE